MENYKEITALMEKFLELFRSSSLDEDSKMKAIILASEMKQKEYKEKNCDGIHMPDHLRPHNVMLQFKYQQDEEARNNG